MVRMSNYTALLVFAFVCALWSGLPSRAADACDFVTTAELESAFDFPFRDGGSDKRGVCTYLGKDAPAPLVMINNYTLPPGSERVAWHAQGKANAEKECQVGMLGWRTPGTFEMVPGLGEEAYACSWLRYEGPQQVGGLARLYTAQGPNIFHVVAIARNPSLLEAMAVLVRSALPRLPQ